MLTASEILKRIDKGSIVITPFNLDQLNINSYDIRLSNKLIKYDLRENQALDPKKENKTIEIEIPETGLKIVPGELYLGSTIEYTETMDCIPCIDGRSSIARFGASMHVSAGFGDIGFKGTWTLEIGVIHPFILYPGMRVGQIYYFEPIGEIDRLYQGRYSGQIDPTASRFHL